MPYSKNHVVAASVRIDRAVERRRRDRDGRRRAGDDPRRGERREDPVVAVARAGRRRRDDAVVVRRALRQPGQRRGDGGVRRSGPGAGRGRLRAIARARSVLDVPGRRDTARIDRSGGGGGGCADGGHRSGDRRRRRGARSRGGREQHDQPSAGATPHAAPSPPLPLLDPRERVLAADDGRSGSRRGR